MAKKWARGVKKAASHFSAGLANPRTGKQRKAAQGGRKWASTTASKAGRWARGWAPYRRVLLRLKLPPRGPLRSPENLERSRVIVEALHGEKMRRHKKAP